MDIQKFEIDDFSPTKIAEKLANRMKSRRIGLNVTQKELANQSGVSLGSIKRFETRYQIALQSLLKIALVLDATSEFHQLFPMNQYKGIAEVVRATENRPRKRARDVGTH
ncbi:MAG: helix-turn-helix transcriptional regulator [Candidatus Marinimicrobia bacterium]|jgi:transcriptional regulator with XRE-family HTH domain|nr:helix-turn-helix transcriptional regulator [Candidatus Neomarinimicrobiota bacterium]